MRFVVSMLAMIGVAQATYKSGSVSSYEKFTYGKFATRMKAPDRKGTVSSFFTYWDGPNFYPGGWNELDVEIVPSVEENPLSMNVIYGDGKNKLEDHDYAKQFRPHDDWHTYEFEWTPEYISFSIDGSEVRHMAADAIEAVQFLNKAQSLRMNFWTPSFHSWAEGFNPADMPWYVLYDYVEVFTYNEHKNEFEFHWRDDFNTFDSGRWHKASGGFEANSSIFQPQQVYTANGNLVIKMEPMEDATYHRDHPKGVPHGYSVMHGVPHYTSLGGHAHGHAYHGERQMADDIPSLPHTSDLGLPEHHQAVPVHHDPALVREKFHLHSTSDEHPIIKPVHHENAEAEEKGVAEDEHHEAQDWHQNLQNIKFQMTESSHEPSHYELLHQDAHMTHQEPNYEHESMSQHHDSHISTYHPTHRSLDHEFDDQQDVEPVHFHEHAVHRAFDHADSHDYAHSSETHHEPEYFARHYTDEHEAMQAEPIHHGHPRVMSAQHFNDHEKMQLDMAHEHVHHRVEEHPRLSMSHLSHETTPFEHQHPGSEEHYVHGDVQYKPDEEQHWDHYTHTTEPDHDYSHQQTEVEGYLSVHQLAPNHNVHGHELRESHYVDPAYEPHHEVIGLHDAHHTVMDLTTPERFHEPELNYGGEHLIEEYHWPTFEEAQLHHIQVEHHEEAEGDVVEEDEQEGEVPHVQHGEHTYHMHIPSHHGKRYDHEDHHFVFPHDQHTFEGHSDHGSIYHDTHRVLDHAFDDQHDVEPVHFHEHAIHHAFDHPESHSYHESDFEHEGFVSSRDQDHHDYDHHEHYEHNEHHAPDYEKHIHEYDHFVHPHHYSVDIEEQPYEHQRRFEVQDESSAHVDRSILPQMHFVVEEPMYEEDHHQAFHGHTNYDDHNIQHHGEAHNIHDHEVEYVVDEDGHVHIHEQPYHSTFLQ